MVEKGKIAIVGGMHNLSTGAVEFYDDTYFSSKKEVAQQSK